MWLLPQTEHQPASAKRFSSLIAAEGRLSEAVSEEKRLPFEGYVSLEKIQIRVTIVAIAAKKWCCKSKDLTNLRMVQKNAQSLVFKWVIGSVEILLNHLLVQWNLFPGANVHLFSFLVWSLDFNNSHTNRAWCACCQSALFSASSETQVQLVGKIECSWRKFTIRSIL